jgi:hypothetical protein
LAVLARHYGSVTLCNTSLESLITAQVFRGVTKPKSVTFGNRGVVNEAGAIHMKT